MCARKTSRRTFSRWSPDLIIRERKGRTERKWKIVTQVARNRDGLMTLDLQLSQWVRHQINVAQAKSKLGGFDISRRRWQVSACPLASGNIQPDVVVLWLFPSIIGDHSWCWFYFEENQPFQKLFQNVWQISEWFLFLSVSRSFGHLVTSNWQWSWLDDRIDKQTS